MMECVTSQPLCGLPGSQWVSISRFPWTLTNCFAGVCLISSQGVAGLSNKSDADEIYSISSPELPITCPPTTLHALFLLEWAIGRCVEPLDVCTGGSGASHYSEPLVPINCTYGSRLWDLLYRARIGLGQKHQKVPDHNLAIQSLFTRVITSYF